MTATNNIKAMPRRVRILEKYNASRILQAAFEMERTGGSFAAAIAQAYFCADGNNKLTLLDAFGHLFEKFIDEKNMADA